MFRIVQQLKRNSMTLDSQNVVIFLGQFCPSWKGAMRLPLSEAQTRDTRPDHNTGNVVPYSSRGGFFNVPC